MDKLFIAIQSFFTSRDDEDRGATMVEYGLLVAFIALVALVGPTFLGTQLSALFNDIGDKIF
jgi:pilus assembly protein Flp/PilA